MNRIIMLFWLIKHGLLMLCGNFDSFLRRTGGMECRSGDIISRSLLRSVCDCWVMCNVPASSYCRALYSHPRNVHLFRSMASALLTQPSVSNLTLAGVEGLTWGGGGGGAWLAVSSPTKFPSWCNS